jgi:hypothetical protein
MNIHFGVHRLGVKHPHPRSDEITGESYIFCKHRHSSLVETPLNLHIKAVSFKLKFPTNTLELLQYGTARRNVIIHLLFGEGHQSTVIIG